MNQVAAKKTPMMAFKNMATADWQGMIVVIALCGYIAVSIVVSLTEGSSSLSNVTNGFAMILSPAIGFYFGMKSGEKKREG